MSEQGRTIRVEVASGSYDAVVGSGLIEGCGVRIREAVPKADAVIVVSDSNVAPHYLSQTVDSLRGAGLPCSSFVVPAGEVNKQLGTYGSILQAMAEAQLTRDSVVVALGGGVVGDMAGFAAATYMRGIRVVQMPTTLLSMVDSSVGGKTAIDLSVGKNLVGAFLQPSLVIADVDTLATLTDEVFVDGMGEVVKHAVLASPQLFHELGEHPVLRSSSRKQLIDVVSQNIAIKRDVVASDERERGLRQTLNLGHTLGHAIEAALGYTLGHGQCVAMGLCCIARASERLGWSEPGLADEISRCVAAQGLPTSTSVSPEEVFDQATHDKKRHGSTVNLVVPVRIGEAQIRTVTLDELRTVTQLGCTTA